MGSCFVWVEGEVVTWFLRGKKIENKDKVFFFFFFSSSISHMKRFGGKNEVFFFFFSVQNSLFFFFFFSFQKRRIYSFLRKFFFSLFCTEEPALQGRTKKRKLP